MRMSLSNINSWQEKALLIIESALEKKPLGLAAGIYILAISPPPLAVDTTSQ